MRVNYNWLKEWVDLEREPEELAELLDHLGIEVESFSTTAGDTIFYLDITPNRPDLLSVMGIAREISAKTGKKLKKEIEQININALEKNNKKIQVKVTLESDCPRYIAAYMDDLKVEDSPDLIKNRLEKCGIRPLNNVVDITNYVLLETGHPLHAFDYESIDGHIIVRRARRGETIRTLEGHEKELTEDDLLIADKKKPLALAGIMGGESSRISSDTEKIILESAFFNPTVIRKTSRKLKISTESSYRFEREADIAMLPVASRYALKLLSKYTGGIPRGKLVDTNPHPETENKVSFDYENICRKLGEEFEKKKINKIFSNLGFEIDENNGKAEAIVPSYRRDIEIEEDLTEEVGRFIGYENIEPKFEYRRQDPVEIEGAELLKVKRILVSLGLSEAINIPFIKSEWAKMQGIEPLELRNPLWSDREILRTSLLPGLLRNCRRNLNRGEEDVKLFEIGRIFSEDWEEKDMLGGILAGIRPRKWYSEEKKIDFYSVKGIVEALLEKINVQDVVYNSTGNPLFVEQRALDLISEEETIGCFGLLNQNLYDEDIYGFEFNYKKLMKKKHQKETYSDIHRFPPVKRDLSVIADKKTTYREIKETIESSVTHHLDMNLIDLYISDKLGKNKKSLTFSLTFTHPEKTLTDDVVEKEMSSIIKNLENIGVNLRE